MIFNQGNRTSAASSVTLRLVRGSVRFVLHAAPLVGVFGSPASAQRAQPAPKGWEVTGIRLEMDERQVKAALLERGYAIARTEQTLSFQERVQASMGKTVRTSSAIGEVTATKGTESVRIFFVQTAAGASVSGVTYNVPLGQVSGADAVDLMTRRLGPPPPKRSRSGGAVWCKDGPNPRYCDPMAPSVEVSSYAGTGTSIVMKAGRTLDR
ncbi:MAG TPA: hypothetical protein VF695_16885, partial [Sphingomonas sp.]